MDQEKEIWLTSEELNHLLSGDVQWHKILEAKTRTEDEAIRYHLLENHSKTQGVRVGWILSLVAIATLGTWIFYVFIF